MPLFFIWEVLGGLGIFILGMKSMSDGLQRISGDRIRRFLEKVTGNRLTAALAGSCLASLLQSSSAASILVVGFVNAGLVSVYQALAVLLGTGLGTSVAIQFIAFKVSIFAFPAIFAGVLLTYFSKRRKLVYLGTLLLGGGLVFLGLQVMEAGFSPISQNDLLRGLENRFLSWRVSAAMVGAILTLLVQSGSTATGVVIAMCGSGLVSYEAGAAMIVGEAVGTSIVAVAASINGSPAAKRTAFLFLLINLLAVGAFLLFFPYFLSLVNLFSPGSAELTIANSFATPLAPSVASKPFIARHLANAHTIFNVINMLVFLPLIGFLARNAPAFIPGGTGEADFEARPQYIDVKVVNTPTIAMLQAKKELKRMAEIAREMFQEVVGQFHRYNAKKVPNIRRKKEVLDILQREISEYLVLLARQGLSPKSSMRIPVMLQMVNELKHMGDQNEAILQALQIKKEDKLAFSASAMAEIRALAADVVELVNSATFAVGEDIGGDNDQVCSSVAAVRKMQDDMLENHIKRLTGGKCSVAAGVIFSDIVSAFGRIADYSCTLMEMERDLAHASSVSSD